ncbi:contractile injection system tape measure protein [Photorhabdus australis]|uniref:contractile injection system tape measure protein n=1 Tax=Photorhabdus australis TaxID=286156 RepID=UPI00055EB213|nr:contractile injection system tape measure protein [Photorhabdus australis]
MISYEVNIIVEKNHEINLKSVINRLSISLDVDECHSKKIIEKCSELFKLKLHSLINEEIRQWSTHSGNFSLDKIVLDIGEIIFEDFEYEFIYRLTRRLKNEASKFKPNKKQHLESDLPIPWEIKPMGPVLSMVQCDLSATNTLYSEQFVLENVDHYLQHGDWKSIVSWQQVTGVEVRRHWLIEYVNHQPQQWLPVLAKHCLQSEGIGRLIQISQPEVLRLLCQLFTESTTQKLSGSVWQVTTDIKVTSERLKAAAEYYLQHQMTYINAAQQARTELQVQNGLTPVKNTAENGSNLLKPAIGEVNTLIEINDAEPPFSQPPMQPIQTHHQPDPRQLRYGLIQEAGEPGHIQPDSAIPAPSAQSVLSVSNAGCMILWPLLPTFFSALGLLDKNRFISLEAQREAVCLLDWLIWAEDEIPVWRLTLNKIICGLPMNDNGLWRAPEPEQQTVISQWLEKIIMQLPAWKKMGVSDVRYLFLQRSGELSGLESGIKIHVKPEIYDALLTDWPWPMNMACFSWLNQPLTITWL